MSTRRPAEWSEWLAAVKWERRARTEASSLFRSLRLCLSAFYRLRGRATSISVAFSFSIAPFFAMNAACASGFTTT